MRNNSIIILAVLLIVSCTVWSESARAHGNIFIPRISVKPGMLPGNPFYFFDTFGEKLGDLFAFSESKKALRAINQAEERIAEAMELLEQEKAVKAEVALGAIAGYLDRALEKTEKSHNKEDVAETVADATIRHLETLLYLYEIAPDEAKPVLLRALEAAKSGHERAVAILSDERREKFYEFRRFLYLNMVRELEEIQGIESQKGIESQMTSQPSLSPPPSSVPSFSPSPSPSPLPLASPNPSVPPAPALKQFDMIAKQWSFEPGNISVKQGDTVRLRVKSVDVTHGIAIPDFNVNKSLTPGETVTVEFVADKKGTFTFFCSIFCGVGHANMKGTLVVE